MSKYIIEIEDVPFSKVRFDDNGTQNINLYKVKDFNALVFDKEGLDKLTPLDKELDEAYQRGLDDAWECARKIVTWPDRSLVNSDTFDLDLGENIFTKYSASRAIEKLKAYEEQQKADGIKVGDEVAPINALSRPFVVVSVKDNIIHGFDLNGGCTSRGYFLHETTLRKTGRYFPQVVELIKAMKNEVKTEG